MSMKEKFNHENAVQSSPGAIKGVLKIGEKAILGIALIRPKIARNERLAWGWAFHEFENGYPDVDDDGEYWAMEWEEKPLIFFDGFDSHADCLKDLEAAVCPA